MPTLINTSVLMSDTDSFRVEELNPYSDKSNQPDPSIAATEHQRIRQALTDAGVEVIQVKSPAGCQDGVYTANWALVRGNKAVMARLPNLRQAEEPYAAQVLRELGKEIITIPDGLKFSGQGDALPCGNYLFCGSNYRSDPGVHGFLSDTLGYKVISLQTVPATDASGTSIINAITGWPDSFFYDIDLSISVLRPDLIAWCPAAFLPHSQDKIAALPVQKIEVSYQEAVQNYACNLISTGETVIMGAHAPLLQAQIEAHGLKTVTPDITELSKGGGYIRCTSLTLDNL